MKNIFLALAIATGAFASCNNNADAPKQTNTNTTDTGTTKAVRDAQPVKKASVTDILTGYLDLKNALTRDDAAKAADAGKTIAGLLTTLDNTAFTPEQKKTYDGLKADIKEHAEHIGANEKDITHQREHFEMLSKDMYDLVKAVGTSLPLYKDFCPMYNEGKGAAWLSETKEIKNPYFGKKMPICGSVKEEIK